MLFVVPRACCTALLLLLLYYQCVVDKPKGCDVIPLFLSRGLSRIGFFFFFCVIFHTLFGSVSPIIGSIKDTSAAKVLSRRRLLLLLLAFESVCSTSSHDLVHISHYWLSKDDEENSYVCLSVSNSQKDLIMSTPTPPPERDRTNFPNLQKLEEKKFVFRRSRRNAMLLLDGCSIVCLVVAGKETKKAIMCWLEVSL